jgi:RNA polymerase sigma factor (sigma-70 family)
MKPDNDNKRPASFDAAVMQWLPLMRKLAYRFERNEQDREDLVQDTLASALHLWGSYNPEFKMAGWLAYQMRSQVKKKRRMQGRVPTTSLDGIQDKAESDESHSPKFARSLSVFATHATQEGAASARSCLAALSDSRGDNALVRLAAGDTLAEIGDGLGVSRERVRQITDVARGRFAKRVGWKAAA